MKDYNKARQSGNGFEMQRHWILMSGTGGMLDLLATREPMVCIHTPAVLAPVVERALGHLVAIGG